MYDLEPWKRPTGIIENVIETPPGPDDKPAPAGPTRDTERVSLEIHRLKADYHRLVIDKAHCQPQDWAYNPSLIVYKDKLLASVRLYMNGNTRGNIIGEIDESWALVNQRALKHDVLDPPFKWLPGFEDLRLFTTSRGLHAAASVCARTHDGRFRAVMAILDFDDGATTVKAAHYQESKYAEKNWMPIVEGDDVRFVYQTEPTIIIRWDAETRSVVPAELPGGQGMMRGGTQLLPLPDGRYLACVHENRAPAGHSVGRYAHRFVLFDRFRQLERKSELFVFKETGIEFCAGIALWRGKLVLSFGLQDTQAWLAVMDLDDALKTVGYKAGPITLDDKHETPTAPELPADPEDPFMQSDLEPHLKPRPSEDPRNASKAPGLASKPSDSVAEAAPRSAAARPAAPEPHAGPPDEMCLTTLREGLDGWCSERKARRLADIVQKRGARTVVEIGVFGAKSLLALAVGARRVGARVIGIDPYTAAASLEGSNSKANDEWWSKEVDYEKIYRRAVEVAAIMPNTRILRAKSLDVAKTCPDGSVDVLHIDGNHSEESSCADVETWLPKLSLGAIVVMDDVAWESTKRAQKRIVELGCVELDRFVGDPHGPEKADSWAIYQRLGGI